MMKRKLLAVAACACAVAGGTAWAQSSTSATSAGGSPKAAGTSVSSRQAVHTESMQRLQDSADRLRQSIQALAQKPPGPDRERALSQAREALQGTQQAMMSLPPELRSSGTVNTAGYDPSVRKLMDSADSLRHAIQEMAQQPAGERRNQAIAQAHRALRDTQAAMLAAYQPGSSGQAMGASASSASSQGHSQGSQGRSQNQGSAMSSSSAEPAAVLVLLPNAQAQGTRLADGCWVRFFDETGFRGDTLTLAGPVDLPRMEMGNAWRDWDSAIVGPKATVRTYDNENFRERTAVLRPGLSAEDLGDQKLGWFEEVKSARVTCS